MEMFGTAAGLWLAVVISGLYHGLNPGMGWPLAVSSSLMERRQSALFSALLALAVGHFLAMLVVLLPFSAMNALVRYDSEIRIIGSLVLIGLGLYLLITRRHPRFLSRVPPNRLALWSFLVALVHGAALMLVPIYLGLCRLEELDRGHQAAAELMVRNTGLLLGVSLAHTAAMVVAGGGLAYAVYRWLGTKFLTRTWFDLEAVWAGSLVLVGSLGLHAALAG